MFEKLRVEDRAGIRVVDLLCAYIVHARLAQLEGLGAPIIDVLPAVKEEGVWRTNPYQVGGWQWVMISNAFSTTLIRNTDLVKEGEIISWNDLLDPKWKGKMVMTDPRRPGPGAAGIYTFVEKLGEDFWKKMDQQDLLLVVDYGQVVDMVVHGERPLALFPSGSRAAAAIAAGTPITPVHLKEGTDTIPKGLVLIKDAPHPNAALVVLNWTLTKEGQAATAKAWANPSLRNDLVEDWVPPGFRFEDAYKVIEPPLGVKDPDYTEIGVAIAKKMWPG
ncbi:ABC transporter substrate-binding protein [Chloroflexota bacterium]